MSLSSGTRLGRYEIISLIGAGGMGEVYRARDPKIQRDVAIKILRASFAANEDRLQRFEREARAAGALSHPGIVSIYDVQSENGSPYVVTELLEGESLRDRIQKGVLPLRKTIDYCVQIATAMAAAHEKGIIHRDLKPENVFITRDDRVKILDFGLAKLTQQRADPEEQSILATEGKGTDSGMLLGTTGYMSPEQVRGQALDYRSDIFSFGILLYELCLGSRPFGGNSQVETLNAILKEDPPGFADSLSAFPPAVERIVRRCLEKKPEHRFQSTSDLAFALETLSGASGQRIKPSGAEIRPAPPPTTRRFLPWLLGLLLLSSLIGAWAYMTTGKNSAPPVADVLRFSIALPGKVLAHVDVETHNVSISPDGRHVALIATSGARRSLWIRSLDEVVARKIDGTEDAISPFWSPDSSSVAFFAKDNLRSFQLRSGTVQTICRLPDVSEAVGSWNTDGTIVFVLRDNAYKDIYRVSSRGGSYSVLRKSDSFTYWLHFLPDGKHFLYAGDDGKNEKLNLYVATLDSNEAKLLLTANSRMEYANGYLLYAQEGALVSHRFDINKAELSGDPVLLVEKLPTFAKTGWAEFSVSQNGTLVYLTDIFKTELLWVDRNGREVGHFGEAGTQWGVRLSPDGQKVLVSINDERSGSGDLWIVDSKRSTKTRLASGPADDGEGVWSPDSEQVAYFSCCEQETTLLMKTVKDPQKARPLLKSGFHAPMDWSGDGRYILYGAKSTGLNQDIWVLPLSGTPEPYPFLQTEFNESAGRFSPDGRRVAYTSDESGHPEIYVVSFTDPMDKIRISFSGGMQPRWRRDGKELFYLSPDNKMMSVSINATNGFEASSPVELFIVSPYADKTYDVSPDGRQFLFSRSVSDAQSLPFNVVLNWPSLLQKAR